MEAEMTEKAAGFVSSPRPLNFLGLVEAIDFSLFLFPLLPRGGV